MTADELTPLGFNARVGIAKKLAKEIESDGYKTRLETDADIERVRVHVKGHGFLIINNMGRLNSENCRPQRGIFITTACLLGIKLLPDKTSRPYGEKSDTKRKRS